jgi:hypothetical protein
MDESQYHSGQDGKERGPYHCHVSNSSHAAYSLLATVAELFWLLQVKQYYDDGGLNSRKKTIYIYINLS